MQLKLLTQISLALLWYFCIVCVPASAYEIEEETGSLLLTGKDFNGALKESSYLLVNFHALWCRYSKKLKPEWQKLSEALKAEKSPIKLAKVEAYDEKALATEFGIEGFPTIKLFINGVEHPYTGERLASHILEFLHRKTKSPLPVVKSVEMITGKLKEYEWIGVYFGNYDAPEVILDTAFDISDVYFVSADSSVAALKQKYNAEKGEFLLVNNITGSFEKFSHPMTKQNLIGFIESKKFPAVARFSKGTAERVFLSEEPSMILIKKDDVKGKSAETAFREASNTLKDKIFMSVASYEEGIGRLLAENIGVDESELPAVRIVRADKERIRKYYLDKEINSKTIVSFYEDYSNNIAKRSYLSEPIPTKNGDIVQKIVTKNFEEIVLNPQKDALVLFWTPWCGHCRAMMPVFDNVGRKVREVANFEIGKIDVSVNDVEKFGLDIVEYPTILLFRANDKKHPIEFQGERNEYVFNDFIRAHASVSLSRMKGPNPFDKNEL